MTEQETEQNPMKEIEISKVIVNIGEGQVGDGVEKAHDLIEKLTGKTPVRTESNDSAKTFGLRSGLNIGAMTTIRGEDAEELLNKVAPAVDQIKDSAFDGNGNFSFGVSEYIDVPGLDYDADIGMKGFQVIVVLERPGYRVKKRDYKPSEIGDDHKVSDEEAKEFIEENLEIEVSQ
ncbi:50S ribosomal protein L5 [Candidatus Nanohalobium constans]|uniref:50S ribosomal protein L5 n=1 Tax=Candidatus Nanohalobium constans TaxID=2565781 RepID=A0A5Q0UI07_9ARCH|nr:50S ribosomal protein L5 [Candidatus Nanohalobium constans]QGA80971.1 50S ribosomal protein L5 [Candidatus Nanohalobium constans]